MVARACCRNDSASTFDLVRTAAVCTIFRTMLSVRYLHARPLYSDRRLSVRGVGIRETMPPGLIARPTGTGDCLLMMFHSPTTFGPAKARQALPAGSIVFWQRGAGQFYGSEAGRWQHSWVHCDGAELAAIFRRAKAPLNQPFAVHDPAVIDWLLYDLHEEIENPDGPDGVIIRNCLENLVRKAVAQNHRPRRQHVPGALLRARAHIDEHYHQPLRLGDLAKIAGWSPRHFCIKFRKQFGVSPMAYLIQRRLHAAAALLRGTDLQVGEIGQRVGYPDRYYFSRHFKMCFGVAPTALRE